MQRLRLALLAFVIAALSVGGVWLVVVLHVMRSIPPALETTLLAAPAIIAAGFFAALFFVWRAPGGWSYRAALAVMLIAGLAPALLHWRISADEAARREIEAANRKAEQQAVEAKFLARIEAYKKDVAKRLAAKSPYAPQEAQAFLDFVQGANLSYRSLPDYTPQAFPLLKQALDGKVLDPNARVKGSRDVDVEEPLFVAYYKFYLQSGVTMHIPRVREREWAIFQMLIAGGANLDDPAAAVLRDVAKRETEPYDPNVPGYVRLK